jgi:hypothetical protein
VTLTLMSVQSTRTASHTCPSGSPSWRAGSGVSNSRSERCAPLAGYVDCDGRAMAISPEIGFSFRALMWKHMSVRPFRGLR